MTQVGKGAHYTYAQLEKLWIEGGGTRATAPIAAAIAEAESQGWSNNVNEMDTNGAGSYGLWQINNGTTFSSQGPNYGGPAGWNNPVENARLAVAKYHGAGNGWTPWGTYTSGAYLAYLRGAVPPSSGNVSNPIKTTSKTGPTNANTTSFWGDVEGAAGVFGENPLGIVASGFSEGISSGIEEGIINSLKDVWEPIGKRIFYGGEMLIGGSMMFVAVIALVLIGLARFVGSHKNSIAAVAAAPETGGASLLLGASAANRQQRARRQGVTTQQGQDRITIAQRRVAVQESQERRRIANAQQQQTTTVQPTSQGDLDTSVARARARAAKMRAARRNRGD